MFVLDHMLQCEWILLYLNMIFWTMKKWSECWLELSKDGVKTNYAFFKFWKRLSKKKVVLRRTIEIYSWLEPHSWLRWCLSCDKIVMLRLLFVRRRQNVTSGEIPWKKRRNLRIAHSLEALKQITFSEKVIKKRKRQHGGSSFAVPDWKCELNEWGTITMH